MKEYKILVLEEDELRSSASLRLMYQHNHVIVRKNDGTCRTIKDRWDYPGNTNKVEIYLPCGETSYVNTKNNGEDEGR